MQEKWNLGIRNHHDESGRVYSLLLHILIPLILRLPCHLSLLSALHPSPPSHLMSSCNPHPPLPPCPPPSSTHLTSPGRFFLPPSWPEQLQKVGPGGAGVAVQSGTPRRLVELQAGCSEHRLCAGLCLQRLCQALLGQQRSTGQGCKASMQKEEISLKNPTQY